MKIAFAFIGALALSACVADGVSLASKSPAATGSQVSRNLTSAISAGAIAPRNGETRFSAYLTGYSFWDNTPPGSAAIARPVIRRRAGGTGTYTDPITIAVGHAIYGSRQVLDYPAGTRFYFPALRKYAIVEDVCGDGNMPQNGPCHSGHNGLPWLDIYVDGSSSARGAAHSCASKLTRVHTVIRNPRSDYPVVAGKLTESGCPVFGA